MDLDGVLVIAHSEKQDAAATWKKAFVPWTNLVNGALSRLEDLPSPV
ncbi:hypothetical protein [Streptomyces sp. SD15]